MNTKTLFQRGALASSIAAILSSTAVLAQGDNPDFVEEVIVVASTRTNTELSKTSAAVTALTAATMTNAGITDPTYLQEQTPNLTINRANGLQVTIRGVTSNDNTEKGDPSAAFLLDGVYIARAQSQEVSFFDLEQVEILRGPQGTLYGRNATAGLINVISARPDPSEMKGSVDATFGDFDKRQVAAMINVPISDSAAIRAAINYDKRDSFLEKLPEARDIDPAKDNLSFRLSGLFELSDTATLYVKADHDKLKGNNRAGASLANFYDLSSISVPTAGQRGNNPRYIGGSNSSEDLRTATYADPRSPSYDNNSSGVMAELNWEFNENLTLTYIGSYREFERSEDYELYFGSAGPFNITSPALFEGDYKQDSNELRLTYSNDYMNLQGGIYQFSEESGIEFLLVGLLTPTPGEDGYVFGFPQDPTIADSLAAFAQGTFDLSSTLRLTAGLRHTEDEKSRRGASIRHRNLGEALNFESDPVTNPLADSLNNADVDYGETTWKLGLDFDINDDILAFATVSTGYKAGGFNDGCLASDESCQSPLPRAAVFYDPETLTSLEAGIKMDFDNGLRAFITAFNYDYENLQLSSASDACGGPCQITSNAGEAEITGLELESRYRINERNVLHFDATWLDAEYTDYQIVEGVNLKGEPLNRSPKYTLNLRYEHSIPLNSGADISVNAAYRWSDKYYILDPNLVAQFEQPSFSKSDLWVTYNSADSDWYVQAFVKNIEDEVTVSGAGVTSLFPFF